MPVRVADTTRKGRRSLRSPSTKTHVDLATATDLNRWADLRESQGQFPRLVRRLIAATAKGLQVLSMRTGEGVGLPGWDGITDAQEPDTHVPGGRAVWEIGVNADPAAKANEDYRKRTANPGDVVQSETTYVFVTPRRWRGKDEWVENRREEGIWKNVIAYDADDLEAWLDRAPSVHAWLSALVGKEPYEAESLESWWDSWATATEPPLPPSLILSGRETAAGQVREAVAAPSASLALTGDSQEEAVALVAAALIGEAESGPSPDLERALIVRTPGAWRRLAVADTPLVLLPLFERPDVTLATRGGHTVIVPLGREVDSGSGVAIPRPRRSGIEAALVRAGISEDRAASLATVGRRSLLSLRRTLAVRPEVHAPEWSRPDKAREILPAVLAGQWIDSREGDRAAIAQLAGRPYDEVAEQLTLWANSSDPPVRRVGDVWLVAAKHDAWALTARFLTPEDLRRFQDVVQAVIGGDDPSLDLAPQERPMASIFGKQRPHSGHLIEGFADTVALMASTSEQIPLAGGRRGQEEANRAVWELLEAANQDVSGRRWIAIASSLPLLAEAAPDVVLRAVEAGLRGEDPVVLRLFQDGDGFDSMFGSSAHPSLLWALENLAWSPEHLGRSALLLAKLARLDPGGRLGNRPVGSLRDVLLLWRPGTAATLDQRLQVVDLLRRHEPDVAWSLMLDLIPSGRDSATATHAPRRRDWKPESRQVLWRDLIPAVEALTARVLQDAGASGHRWAALARRADDLPPGARAQMLERLETLEWEALDDEGRAVLANAVRQLVGKHREHPDADWAIPQEDVDRLEGVISGLEPESRTLRHAWLFDQGAMFSFRDLPRGDRRDALSQAQEEAIREVYADAGLDGVLAWAGRFESVAYSAQQIGLALGAMGLDETAEETLFRELLSDAEAHRRVAASYASQVARTHGAEWVDWAKEIVSQTAGEWTPAQQGAFLSALPAAPGIWDLATTLGEETDREYWQRAHPYGLPDRGEALVRAARKLVEYSRPHEALELLDVYADDIPSGPPPDFVAEVLEQAARTPWPARGYTTLSYHVGRHLDRLLDSGFDESRLAKIEWMYLPLFRYDHRPAGVLHRALAADPTFFAEIVSIVYRAEGEEPGELSESELSRARTARELLDSWRSVPGTQDDGALDGEALRNWVGEARRLLQERGRVGIGDHCIGQVLRYGPGPQGDEWPGEWIREVIEEVGSDELEDGFVTAVYNSRGVTSRGLLDGGQQERALAATYRRYASSIEIAWPRTAAMLRRIAQSYQHDAERNDADADLTEDLWR